MVRNYAHAGGKLDRNLQSSGKMPVRRPRQVMFDIVGTYPLWLKFCTSKIFRLPAWNSLDGIVSALTLLRSWLGMS